MRFINLKYKDYAILPPDEKNVYNYAIRNGESITKGKDVFNIGEVRKLGFGVVKDLQSYFNDPNATINKFIRYIFVMQKYKKDELYVSSDKIENDIYELRIFDIMQQYFYTLNQIKEINDNEKGALSSTPSSLEIQAGIEELGAFNEFIQYNTLTNGLVKDIKEISSVPYNICFIKLSYDKKKADYQGRLDKLNRQKQQQKRKTWN